MLADAVKILFALGLPFVTGALFVMALGRTSRPGQGALIAGMGLPLGLVVVIGGYLALGTWGPGLHFYPNLVVQLAFLLLFALLAWWRWRRTAPASSVLSIADQFSGLSAAGRWLFFIIAAWLVLRCFGIFVEVVYRPLFPWDAWYAYGMTTKVFFFHPQLDVFAGGWRWFEAESPVWVAGGMRHPPGVSLMQLWSLQALGRYDDALMNLAWPLALASVGLSIFGTLRMVGGSLLVSIGGAALVVTLPVLNIQAVLAGYGDIWIGLLLLLAVIGVVLARLLGLQWLTVTVVAAAGMLMIKETSWLWMPVLLLGLVAAWVRIRWLVLFGIGGLVGLFALLWIYGEPIRVSTLGWLGFYNGEFVFPKRINLDAWREIVMWPELLRHMFVYRNWHLFWYLVPFIAVASISYARSQRIFAMAVVVAWGGLALLIGFFSFSTMGNAVIDGTSVNRLLLHLVPVIGLLGGLTVLRWQGRLVSGLRT